MALLSINLSIDLSVAFVVPEFFAKILENDGSAKGALHHIALDFCKSLPTGGTIQKKEKPTSCALEPRVVVAVFSFSHART